MTASPINQSKPLVLHLGPVLQRMSAREFFDMCQMNDDSRIERTAEGDLIIMPPTGGETGRLNFRLYVLFNEWAERDGSGLGFDSSTGFALANGAIRSPDLAWITYERWNALSKAEKEAFIPLCPDFVIELRSRSDSLSRLQAKMREFIDNGARLGWLIDAVDRKVYVYAPGAPERCLEDEEKVAGDPVLPGFILDLVSLFAE